MSGVPLDIVIVVGEPSGDQLGFKLMRALSRRLDGCVSFRGVGGSAMAAEGMPSLFPLDDIAVMGFAAVAARFPTIYRRVWQTVEMIVASPPDLLILIDSPDFTHAVARRVRRRLPDLAIVDYVSPSVWAWRPGRAKAMRPYVDHVLALLPFEPEAHRRLGGPACTYVGHPLVERFDELRPNAEEALRRAQDPPLVLALPGSRSGEIARLLDLFGVVLGRMPDGIEVALPTLPRHIERVRAATACWPVSPRIIIDEAGKFAAFRRARSAIAASGTVTLELALSGIPTIGAYRVPGWEAFLARRLIQVPSVLLPNLILGEPAVPEFLQENATPDKLVAALTAATRDGPERRRQLDAMARLDIAMQLPGGEAPSDRAAQACLDALAAKRALSPQRRWAGDA